MTNDPILKEAMESGNWQPFFDSMLNPPNEPHHRDKLEAWEAYDLANDLKEKLGELKASLFQSEGEALTLLASINTIQKILKRAHQ